MNSVKILLTALTGLMISSALSHAQSQPDKNTIRTVFEGMTVLRTESKKLVPVEVKIVKQSIPGESALTLTGHLIVQFRAGELEIADEKGAKRELNEGDFFTIAQGETITLHTDDDSAIITIIRVNEFR